MNSTNELITTARGDIVGQEYFYDYEDIKDRIDNDTDLDSHNTRRGYKADIGRFLDWLGGREFNKGNVEEYLAHLRDVRGNKNTTINRVLSALRWLARTYKDRALDRPVPEDIEKARDFVFRQNLAVRQMDRILTIKIRRTAKRQARDVGRHVHEKELGRLLEACSQSPRGTRDATLIALAYATGARQGELRTLQLDDLERLDPETFKLTFTKTKNKEDRPAWVNNGAAMALVDWLEIRGEDPGPVFCPVDRVTGDLLTDNELSAESLRKLLNKRIKKAKIEHLTWHDFRRTAAGDFLEAGADLATVSKLLGHKDPETTSGYDRRDEQVRAKAQKSRYVPYRRRTLGGE